MLIQCPICGAVISPTSAGESYFCPHCNHLVDWKLFLSLQKKLKEAQLAQFRRSFFPIYSPIKSVQTVWEYWNPSIHDTIDEYLFGQLHEQVDALYRSVPVFIDKERLHGLFWDNGKLYQTSLKICSCSHFNEKRLPCSHMYRLFYDLSFARAENEDTTNIARSVLEKFAKLSKECQEDFINRIIIMEEDGYDCVLDESACKEIEAGLIIRQSVIDYTVFLNKYSRDEVILLLRKSGLSGFQYSWSKARLIVWVLDNHPDFFQKHFVNCAHLSINPDSLSWMRKIKNLLNNRRKSPSFWYEVLI